MNQSNEIAVFPPGRPGTTAWYCLRTLPKHEHIAAAQLRLAAGLEVYSPRIRFQRMTTQGPAWATEALFQNYIFARFDLLASLRHVQAARGVRGVVHFGSRWPVVPDAAIQELRAAMEDGDLRVVEDTLRPGDMVRIADGAMHGLQAVVTRVMPARQRAAVLLEFLGRQTTVEVDRRQLVVTDEHLPRRAWLAASGPVARPCAVPA